MSNIYVVHYSEVALKGKNRPEFARLLRKNIKRALAPLPSRIDSLAGRLLVHAEGDELEVARRVSSVFGVAWFGKAAIVDSDYPKIEEAVLDLAKSSSASSFRVDVRRADKTFPLSSMELARRLGAEVVKATRKRVDLSEPGLVAHVDIIGRRTLTYSRKTQGPGGLPVGSAGRVLHLFSGGIDSPVAAWLLMKRGCVPVYMHFYLAPNPEGPIKSKITKLLDVLSSWGGKTTLVLVPFADYQLATGGVPPDLEPSLFRRFMRLTAELLAPEFGAAAIATGDSLSQAASQTLWNIASFDQGSSLPILRPLLSYDKEEIVTLAKKIGTYEASLEEYKDCCAIITRHPKTRTKATLIDAYAKSIGFQGLALRSIDRATLVTWGPGDKHPRVSPLSRVLRASTSDQTATQNV